VRYGHFDGGLIWVEYNYGGSGRVGPKTDGSGPAWVAKIRPTYNTHYNVLSFQT